MLILWFSADSIICLILFCHLFHSHTLLIPASFASWWGDASLQELRFAVELLGARPRKAPKGKLSEFFGCSGEVAAQG